MTKDQIQALQNIAKAIIETANDCGNTGAPAGPIYASLMSFGASFNQFHSIMDTLTRKGFLTHDIDCHTYHATPIGLAWAAKV